jgi:hypothetical protein
VSATLIPDPSRLPLDLLHSDDQHITLLVCTTDQTAGCPLCAVPAARAHSRYVRTLADLPWNGTM